ncbi:MAG: hypothetical protein IPM39_25830 [Chloroflexi bacterium]|nr:hypothetical protein [Chloroflexota bacterium]
MDRTRKIFIGIIGIALIMMAGIFLFSRATQATAVTGVIGSEKIPFFEDPEVRELLLENGLDVQVQKAGSREIATSYDLSQYDFAFPAGIPAAQKCSANRVLGQSYAPFFTPIVIASWQPIADLLVANGVAADQGGYYTFDMNKYLELVAGDTRWSDLPNNDTFPVNKSILLTSTDVRKSNSAAMYLALASYIANEENIVQTMNDAEPLLPLLKDIFLRQGLRLPAVPRSHLKIIWSKAWATRRWSSSMNPSIIAQAASTTAAAFPTWCLRIHPTIFTEHVLLPLTENGAKLGELLKHTPSARVSRRIRFAKQQFELLQHVYHSAQHYLPDTIVDVVEPPSYEVLEGMIQQIEKRI